MSEQIVWSDGRSPDLPGNCFRQICGKCRVLVNGVDVTKRCYAFNIPDGIAGCYIHDAEGKPQWDGKDGVLSEELHGVIEVHLL